MRLTLLYTACALKKIGTLDDSWWGWPSRGTCFRKIRPILCNPGGLVILHGIYAASLVLNYELALRLVWYSGPVLFQKENSEVRGVNTPVQGEKIAGPLRENSPFSGRE